jgi:hypothetical protein
MQRNFQSSAMKPNSSYAQQEENDNVELTTRAIIQQTGSTNFYGVSNSNCKFFLSMNFNIFI